MPVSSLDGIQARSARQQLLMCARGQGAGGAGRGSMRALLAKLRWLGLGGRRWAEATCLFTDSGFELSVYSRCPAGVLFCF